jgi:hypothetical protein
MHNDNLQRFFLCRIRLHLYPSLGFADQPSKSLDGLQGSLCLGAVTHNPDPQLVWRVTQNVQHSAIPMGSYRGNSSKVDTARIDRQWLATCSLTIRAATQEFSVRYVFCACVGKTIMRVRVPAVPIATKWCLGLYGAVRFSSRR